MFVLLITCTLAQPRLSTTNPFHNQPFPQSYTPTSTNMRYSAVIGAVNGKFSAVFTALTKLQAKQNFAFAIIAGNLCGDLEDVTEEQTTDLDKLLEGKINVSLPTYFSLCLLYTSPSPRDGLLSRMPSSA